MRINLRGRNIGMAENSLHGAKIGTILHHVRGAGMPQHVRARVTAGSQRGLTDELPNSLASQSTRANSNKQQWRGFHSS